MKLKNAKSIGQAISEDELVHDKYMNSARAHDFCIDSNKVTAVVVEELIMHMVLLSEEYIVCKHTIWNPKNLGFIVV